MKKPSESNQGTFLPQGLAAPFSATRKIWNERRGGFRAAAKRLERRLRAVIVIPTAEMGIQPTGKRWFDGELLHRS